MRYQKGEIMTTLTNAERETILTMTADDRQTWHVFSDDPVMIARLERMGATRTETRGDSAFFTLTADQVLLRRGKRRLSEETRIAQAQRLRALSGA